MSENEQRRFTLPQSLVDFLQAATSTMTLVGEYYKGLKQNNEKDQDRMNTLEPNFKDYNDKRHLVGLKELTAKDAEFDARIAKAHAEKKFYDSGKYPSTQQAQHPHHKPNPQKKPNQHPPAKKEHTTENKPQQSAQQQTSNEQKPTEPTKVEPKPKNDDKPLRAPIKGLGNLPKFEDVVKKTEAHPTVDVAAADAPVQTTTSPKATA